MVSADNLNFDVLELIFAFLSWSDLPSIALVSRSFQTVVTPGLYRNITYRIRQAKGYIVKETISPFATVLAHRQLASHVQKIDIRAIPKLKNAMHPVFMRECREVIRICKNLKTFTCTVQNALPVFLPILEEKSNLQNLRVYANLTSEQAKMVAKLKGIHTLFLEFASWNTVDVLPSWSQVLSSTLTILSLFMINELHEEIFDSVLSHLPNLTGLHVVGCTKVDHRIVLQYVGKIPLLESLSFTTSENTKPLCTPAPILRNLKNLAFDTRYMMQPSPSPAILSALMTHLKHSLPNLTSFVIRMPERKVTVGNPFIDQLLEGHKHSIHRIAFLDCAISRESLIKICQQCIHLERLDVAIPVKDIGTFSRNISHSKTLHTIVDADNHVDHGIRPTLNQDNVAVMVTECRNLRKIVTNQRIWTADVDADGNVNVSLERRPSRGRSAGSLWFIPRE